MQLIFCTMIKVNFYSWAHTIRQMKIQQFGNKNVTNITHLSYNTEWTVYDTCALTKVIVTSEELHWWVSSYRIFIFRLSLYHVYNLIMPCFGKIYFRFVLFFMIMLEFIFFLFSPKYAINFVVFIATGFR